MNDQVKKERQAQQARLAKQFGMISMGFVFEHSIYRILPIFASSIMGYREFYVSWNL